MRSLGSGLRSTKHLNPILNTHTQYLQLLAQSIKIFLDQNTTSGDPQTAAILEALNTLLDSTGSTLKTFAITSPINTKGMGWAMGQIQDFLDTSLKTINSWIDWFKHPMGYLPIKCRQN